MAAAWKNLMLFKNTWRDNGKEIAIMHQAELIRLAQMVFDQLFFFSCLPGTMSKRGR